MQIEGLLIAIVFGLCWWIATYFVGFLEMLAFTILFGAVVGLILRYIEKRGK